MDREIGGYIELDTYHLPMLHDDGIFLNSGRTCLSYLIKTKNIKRIVLPWFCCDVVRDVCFRENINVRYFSIGEDWLPKNVELFDDEWLYIVNYYGQLTPNTIRDLKNKYKRIIVDNAQAYYAQPVNGCDTLYTCRKFFGVPDGGILFSDMKSIHDYPIDESFDRMNFVLGRFERGAAEFYKDAANNNDIFTSEGIKQMSKLTVNLLHGVDYKIIKQNREKNFTFLHEALKNINQLNLRVPLGPYAYPLMVENGEIIRMKLIAEKIYIPCLWPNVKDDVSKNTLEYNLAANILPLPIDQRYNLDDMEYLRNKVEKCIG